MGRKLFDILFEEHKYLLKHEAKLKNDTTAHKKRNCLKCFKIFISHHKGNRICSQCNSDNKKMSKKMIDEFEILMQENE